jgi:hypothetical protein
VTHTEGRIGILRIPGRVARDELDSPRGLDGEDRAVISSGKRVREPAGLGRVEEDNVVGIGQACLTPPGAPKDAPPDQHDAVSWVRLFGPIRFYVCAATEVHDGNTERLEEQMALVWLGIGREMRTAHCSSSIGDGVGRGSLKVRKKFQARGSVTNYHRGRREKMLDQSLPQSKTFKVAVCDVAADLQAGSVEWGSLCDAVAREEPDLLLLSELPFGPWISSGASFDQVHWERSLEVHAEGLNQLGRLGAKAVAGTRPRCLESRCVNEAFLYTRESGLRGVHTKQYFPNEDGYYEARWFQAGPDSGCVGELTLGADGLVVEHGPWVRR